MISCCWKSDWLMSFVYSFSALQLSSFFAWRKRRGWGGGGTHSPGGEGVGGGGSIFWKTPDIGLASYSIISLRSYPLCWITFSKVFSCCKSAWSAVKILRQQWISICLNILFLQLFNHFWLVWSTVDKNFLLNIKNCENFSLVSCTLHCYMDSIG